MDDTVCMPGLNCRKERFEEEQSKRHKAEKQAYEKDEQLQIERKKAKDLSQKLSAEEAQVFPNPKQQRRVH